jgi:sulfocyanin
MKRHVSSTFAAVCAMTALACGGGDNAATQTADAGGANPCAANPCAANPCTTNPCAGMDMPDWLTIDKAGRTATIDISAGSTDANNYWNFNGHYAGSATIVVPEGYTVTLNFKNDDPLTTHSIGVDATLDEFPTLFDDPSPVFAGAISPNPTAMTDGTASGQSVTLTFVADAAGEYSLVCYIPGHAQTGMWIYFTVSSDGSAGVKT